MGPAVSLLPEIVVTQGLGTAAWLLRQLMSPSQQQQDSKVHRPLSYTCSIYFLLGLHELKEWSASGNALLEHWRVAPKAPMSRSGFSLQSGKLTSASADRRRKLSLSGVGLDCYSSLPLKHWNLNQKGSHLVLTPNLIPVQACQSDPASGTFSGIQGWCDAGRHLCDHHLLRRHHLPGQARKGPEAASSGSSSPLGGRWS